MREIVIISLCFMFMFLACMVGKIEAPRDARKQKMDSLRVVINTAYVNGDLTRCERDDLMLGWYEIYYDKK